MNGHLAAVLGAAGRWALLVGLIGATLLGTAFAGRAPGPDRGRVSPVFDGEFGADLVIGHPNDSVAAASNAGRATILYSTASGLDADHSAFWSQDGPIVDAPETDDYFGSAVATGDFDGDSFSDLVAGVPWEQVGTADEAGAVNVLYGRYPLGLSTADNQFWAQGNAGLVDAAEADDHFGSTLATGDFNGDGYDDLAVGVPDEDVRTISNAGAVHVLYGSASGLDDANDKVWHEDLDGLEGWPEAQDHFGAAVTTGDFDADGYDDLVIGIPGDDYGDPLITDGGSAVVIYGSSGGLTEMDVTYLMQSKLGLDDMSESGDVFGSSLAAGDFNGDGYDDLAVGVPQEDVAGQAQAGAFNVIFGDTDGLGWGVLSQFWSQGSTGISDDPEVGDEFGFSLAVGDFNGDGHDDVAAGVPFENYGAPAITNCGIVQVLFSSDAGVTEADQIIWQGTTADIEDDAEAQDAFGYALAAGDLNGDGHDDLAIGSPMEDLCAGPLADAGMVNVLYGAVAGLSTFGDQAFWDGAADCTGAEAGDRFGHALAMSQNRRRLFLPIMLKSASG